MDIISQVIVMVTVVVAVPLACHLILSLCEWLKQQAKTLESTQMSNILQYLLEIVETSVKQTEQTFTLKMKANGTWTEEAAIQAAKQTFDQTLASLNDGVKSELTEVIGGELEAFIQQAIERKVFELHNAANSTNKE